MQWLEEGRLYRFPTPDRALLATLLYATALGIDHREALELAGLPAPPLPREPVRRLGAVAAFAALVARRACSPSCSRAAARPTPKPSAAASAASTLPAPWAIKVVVLNGSGDIVYTRSVASRVQALSYRVTHVGRATSFNYPQTQVVLPARAARRSACASRSSSTCRCSRCPAATDPRRLVVIVGPERGARTS